MDWKFGQLDTDASGNLTEAEYDQVKKLIRKVVKPKKCSRVFVQLCDVDNDGELTKIEWNQCMALPKNSKLLPEIRHFVAVSQGYHED